MENNFKKSFIVILVVSILVSSTAGGVMGFYAGTLSSGNSSFSNLVKTAILGGVDNPDSISSTSQDPSDKIVRVEEESAVITSVENVSPAVVSIIITKDLPVIERYYTSPPGGSDFFDRFFGDSFGDLFSPSIPQYRQNGTQKQEIGGGSGFLVSADGYIITNQHVVSDEEADYTVLMNDESKHDAQVIARDPVNDIAVIKIEGSNFPYVEWGDSSNLKVGQSVIAIGNALGEFRNTVSTGVISGLSRSITAGGTGVGSEQLTGVIQTDASINPGNSGGPLLNIAGQVIGMNTAIVSGAQNIGFAIPVAEVKSVYDNVKENGRIVRPWLGVRYVMMNEVIAEDNNLDVDYGALIVRGENRTDLAVIPGSPADKAGLEENDIILEIDGKILDENNLLAQAISKHKPGDEVTLKILHDGDEKDVKVTLEEME